MSNVFEGKVAFITGGVGGIGQEYTKALLRKNVKGVALIDIDEITAENFQNELVNEFGPNKTIFIRTDITNIKDVEDAFENTIAHFNQLDIVINNAGIADEIDIEKTLNINLTAVTRITLLALETYLPKHKVGVDGFVVNTASIGGLVPLPFGPAYSVSKHGVVALGRCLGTPAHFKRTQVKVLTICPGKIDTNITIRRPQQYLDILEPLKKMIHRDPIKIELLGDTLIKVITEGSNGSIWVLDQNKPDPYELNYPQIISTF